MLKKILKKILKYIILVTLLIANIRYVYNEFNIYLKNENHTLRHFLHPKYRKYWKDEEGVGHGFNSEYGDATLLGKILEDKYTYKLGLRVAKGWGYIPDFVNGGTMRADMDPKEDPSIILDVTIDEYDYVRLIIETNDMLDGTYNCITVRYYEEEEKKEPKYITIFIEASNNSPKDTSYYIYPGIYGIGGRGGIGENASEISFSQKEAKEMIEKITNLKITEIFLIADEAIEHLMKSYKNVLFKGTVYKILKTIVIFIIQIFLYKVFVYILYQKKKYNEILEQKYF